MQTFKTKLTAKEEIAEKTIEFKFEKPELFEFKAGQHVNFKLPELYYEDKKGPRRTFTIASSPQDRFLKIATRLTGSGFKKTLLEMPNQSELEFIGPMGNFALDQEYPAVFIAGGIGITPFKSILTSLENVKLKNKIGLFYSNKAMNRAAYYKYFTQYKNSGFTFIPIFTDEKDWQGENKRPDINLIKEYNMNLPEFMLYLCGSQKMVQQLTEQLNNANIKMDRIRAESFFGY